jgi:hypothetical protein
MASLQHNPQLESHANFQRNSYLGEHFFQHTCELGFRYMGIFMKICVITKSAVAIALS